MATQSNAWPPVLLVVGAIRPQQYAYMQQRIQQVHGTVAIYKRGEERIRKFVQAALVVSVAVDERFLAGDLEPLSDMPEQMQRVSYAWNAWNQTSIELLELPLDAVQVVVMERAFYRLVDPMFGGNASFGHHLQRWMGHDVHYLRLPQDSQLEALARREYLDALRPAAEDVAVPV